MQELILSLETATLNCSVSLSGKEGVILTHGEISEKYIHSEKLHVFIRRVLHEAGRTPQDLTAIAVDKGPGSYTGLRIGVSAAKGLCYALNIPLISLDSLSLMAKELIQRESFTEKDVVIPMIDARRMEVYCAEYDHEGNPLSEIEAKIIEEGSFRHLENRRLHFLGDGSPKTKTVLSDPSYSFHDIHYPSSETLGRAALEKYREGSFEDVAYFEPFYLKNFIAGKPKRML